MLSPLSDREKAIVECMRMRLNSQESLTFLREHGMPTAIATFYRVRKRLEDTKLQRLYAIAAIGFEDQHMERIDQCEMAAKKMWQQYEACQDPYQKAKILKMIIEVQPYLSSYYEATKEIMNDRATQNATAASTAQDNNVS